MLRIIDANEVAQYFLLGGGGGNVEEKLLAIHINSLLRDHL